MTEAVSHLAGGDVEFNTEDGTVLRQRCSWCGALLIDVNLSRVSVPIGQYSRYPRWPISSFVAAHAPDGRDRGGMWAAVEWEPGSPVPANSCLRMPLEVTG